MASAQAEDGEVVTYNTIEYTYDTRGNILSKTYSLDGAVVDTVTYAYADTVWQDRLTSFDTTAITYDTIGNPLNWTDNATLTWQSGRQLAYVRFASVYRQFTDISSFQKTITKLLSAAQDEKK